MSPDDLLYTKDHEWIRLSGEIGTVGITSYAQKQLGEVVFVELPKAGDRFKVTDAFGNIESVKAVSEMFAPMSGEVVAVNDDVANAPELINEDSYGRGCWSSSE